MPINKIENNKGCITSFTNCIKYDGVDIPCLGIKNGDYINQIVCILVDKICAIAAPQDLSTISVQCLINKFTGITDPLSKTVVSYLQLLINNQCTIKDLIDAINLRIDGITNTNLILDLKCLAIPDSQGNVTYTVQSVLQALITEVCAHRLHLIALDGSIVSLQSQITALASSNYVEPIISSCVYTNKTVSQAVGLLATDYCTYKTTVVGTAAAIQTAIGKQCTALGALFVADTNFIQAPLTLADSENNQWLTICNLLNRITALEACACKVTCKDITIGFITTFNDDHTVELKFTSGAGTNIPAGFTNCGSILTIKNDSGTSSLPINIAISQEGESDPIDISMFESGEYLTFSIEANICSAGLHCQKCVTKVVRNTAGCCLITNSGSEPVTIIYKTCGISTSTV